MKPPAYNDEDMARYRAESSLVWPGDTDAMIEQTTAFAFAVLSYRLGDLGREIRDTLPNWLRRWFE